MGTKSPWLSRWIFFMRIKKVRVTRNERPGTNDQDSGCTVHCSLVGRDVSWFVLSCSLGMFRCIKSTRNDWSTGICSFDNCRVPILVYLLLTTLKWVVKLCCKTESYRYVVLIFTQLWIHGTEPFSVNLQYATMHNWQHKSRVEFIRPTNDKMSFSLSLITRIWRIDLVCVCMFVCVCVWGNLWSSVLLCI